MMMFLSSHNKNNSFIKSLRTINIVAVVTVKIVIITSPLTIVNILSFQVAEVNAKDKKSKIGAAEKKAAAEKDIFWKRSLVISQ